MPESKKISLSLKVVDDWLAEDDKEGSISSAYRQEENPPSIGWHMNCMPTLEGMRSANLFDRVSGYGLPSSLNNSNLYTADTFYDIHGNISYMYFDNTLEVGRTANMYISKEQGSSFNLALSSNVTSLTSMVQRHTLFQNRSIFLKSGADTTGAYTEQGDIGSTNAFVELDFTTQRAIVHNVTGTSISPYDKNGITSWGNYVLLWTRNTLFWSDPNVFTEFTVGGSSLAGSQKISEARGNIVTIVPNSEGFLIYCQENIIHVGYSGDSFNPWIFTEVTGGGGLLMLDGQPLVTKSENTPFQVAYTTKGLQRVTSREASAMPSRIADYVLRSYVEEKALGSSLITRSSLVNAPEVKKPKIKQMFLFDTYLCIVVGASEEFVLQGFDEETRGRLFMFNMNTGQLGIHRGDFLTIAPEIDFVGVGSGNDLYRRNRVYANSFVVVRRLFVGASSAIRRNILDMGGRSDRAITQDAWVPAPSELFFTGVSLSPDSITELLSVKLVGDISISPEYEVLDPPTLARVFVYTEFRAHDKPIEFIYNPFTQTYLGVAVGRELQIEVRGYHFYLTDVELEVQKGGS